MRANSLTVRMPASANRAAVRPPIPQSAVTGLSPIVASHVDRVMRRVGLLPPKVTLEAAHDLVLGLFAPDQMYEAHVNLIQHGRKVCHAQRPDHAACPLLPRCRFVDPKAP